MKEALSLRGGLRLELPAWGDGALTLSLPTGFAVEVHERGTHGRGRHVRAALAYGRAGGNSYWRTTDTGYEEWVVLAEAHEGTVVEWEVRGGQLRQDGDSVLVADASGRTQLRVTAPRAYGPGGREARAWLRAEGNVLALYTTARGQALLDPLWTTVGSMQTGRTDHTATLLSSGEVLVAAGYDGNLLASAELYDPGTGTWSATGSLATARDGHTATLLQSGKVLVVGGQGESANLGSVELYDPGTGTWSATGSPVTARAWHTATLLPSGKVLVAGGFDNGHSLAGAELYDPLTGTWSATGSPPFAPGTATLLSSGKVLVSSDCCTVVPGAALYDPAAGTWSTTGTPPFAPSTATLLLSGNVLVAEGFAPSAGQPVSAALYDPATGTWSATGSLPFAPGTATLLSSGEVLVAAGYDGNFNFLASAELYDPGTGTWSATGSLATAHFAGTATLLSSGRVLVTGGYDTQLNYENDNSPLATAEVFDPGSLLATLAISPASVTLAPRASQTFVASGGTGTGYTWAFVTNASGGTLSAVGVYTAGATSGVSDVVRVTDSFGNSATATVTVIGAVVVSPSSVTLSTTATQTFMASGGSGTGYAWAFVTNASGGTLSAAGVYTAGATGGVSDVIRVTDSLGNSARATVTVMASQSGGCGTTGGDAFPLLVLAVLPLLTLRLWRH